MRENPFRHPTQFRKTMVINDGTKQEEKKKNSKIFRIEKERTKIADAFFLQKKNIPLIANEFGVSNSNVIYAIMEEYPNYEVAATINRNAAAQNVQAMMNF